VVADGVLGLLGLGGVAQPLAQLEQLGVEEQLLRLGVHLEHGRQPAPEDAEGAAVGPVDLVEHREHPPLLVVIVEDHVGDVHGAPSVVADRWVRAGRPYRAQEFLGLHQYHTTDLRPSHVHHPHPVAAAAP
jgi:hypothetical protein